MQYNEYSEYSPYGHKIVELKGYKTLKAWLQKQRSEVGKTVKCDISLHHLLPSLLLPFTSYSSLPLLSSSALPFFLPLSFLFVTFSFSLQAIYRL